jgi:hypothetical protein
MTIYKILKINLLQQYPFKRNTSLSYQRINDDK